MFDVSLRSNRNEVTSIINTHTHIAHVWSLPGVRPLVHGQRVLLGKRTAALFALERTPRRSRPLVDNLLHRNRFHRTRCASLAQRQPNVPHQQIIVIDISGVWIGHTVTDGIAAANADPVVAILGQGQLQVLGRFALDVVVLVVVVAQRPEFVVGALAQQLEMDSGVQHLLAARTDVLRRGLVSQNLCVVYGNVFID